LENSAIIDYKHIQAAHCENGVAAGLLQFHGLDFVSEPLVFGIGSGIFYIHIPFLKINHGPAISFRSMPGWIFQRACKSLDVKVVRKKFKSESAAETFLNQKIQDGSPVGCQVGVFNLPYFPPEYRFHFNAHNIIVYGRENGHYLVSDPVMESVTTLTNEDMLKVRFSKGPLAPRGQVYYPESIGKVTDEMIRNGIKKGIKRTSFEMLMLPGSIVGISGIRYTAREIRRIRKKMGPKKAGNYLGQIVRMQEEIGTGGGGFRFLYAAFLHQASELLKRDDLKVISEDFTKAGDMWRASAMEMAQVYRGRKTEQKEFDIISDRLMEIASVEKQGFKKLAKVKW